MTNFFHSIKRELKNNRIYCLKFKFMEMLKTYGRMTKDRINSKGSNKKYNSCGFILSLLPCIFTIYFTYNEHEKLRLKHIIICHFRTQKLKKNSFCDLWNTFKNYFMFLNHHKERVSEKDEPG